ncbi:MAG: CAP domain-containing protein [Synechococcus sp.]|nr:CAP domain-containing protein [Synechococcus sp.]
MRIQRWWRLLLIVLASLGTTFILEQYKQSSPLESSSPPTTQQEPLVLTPGTKNPSPEIIEQQIHEKINAYRVNLGLKPLTLDYRITNESRKYSAKMASGEATFSHDGFEGRASNLEKQALPYASVAENLALIQGYDDVATVAVEGWIDSPGHHKNIVGDFDLTGIGVVKNEDEIYYFTQLFLKRR